MSASSQLLNSIRSGNNQSAGPGGTNSAGFSSSAKLLDSYKKGEYKPTPIAPTVTEPINTSKEIKTDDTVFGKIFSSLQRVGTRFEIGAQQALGGSQVSLGLIKKKLPFQALHSYGEGSQELIDTGAKNIKAAAEKEAEFVKEKGAAKGFGWLAEQVAQATPSTLASIGIGVAGSLITANPVIGLSLGFSSSFVQTAGSAYQDAKDYGISDDKAEKVGFVSGTASALLDTLPLGRLLSKTPEGKIAKEAVIKQVTKSIIKQGVLEASTEGLQQIVQNAVKETYDQDQSLFEGVPESMIIGGVMGSGSDIAVGGINAVRSIDKKTNVNTDTVIDKPVSPEVDKDKTKINDTKDITPEGSAATRILDPAIIEGANKKVKEAWDTPAENRTPEQSQIVETILTKKMTPAQAVQTVINSGMAETEIGMEINKAAAVAAQEGKVVVVKGDESGSGVKITVEDKTTIELPQVQDNKDKKPTTVKEKRDSIFPKEEKQPFPAKNRAELKNLIDKEFDIGDPLSPDVEKIKNATEKVDTLYRALISGKVDKKMVKMAKSLRARFYEQLYKISGVPLGGNYKQMYAAYQTIRGTDIPQGPLLDKIEERIADLNDVIDNKDNVIAKIAKDAALRSKEAKSQANPALNGDVPGSELKQSQKPVGDSKLRESEAYRKVKDRFEESTQQDVSYNKLNTENDVEKAMNYVASNPEDAIKVAFGLVDPPVGQTETGIAIALADKAWRDGNVELANQLESSRSLRQTRRGQEIVMERGRFNEDSPYRYIQETLDRRLRKLGSGLKADIVSKFKMLGSEKAKAMQKIDSEVTKIKERVSRDRLKITSAQAIIDSLTCKI